MGLFTGLLKLPLAPVRGAAWVAHEVAMEADRQLYDEASILAELADLELGYDEGRIDDEEREAIEADLLARLAISRQHPQSPTAHEEES